MTFRFKSIPIAGVVVATSVLMAACSSHGGESAPPRWEWKQRHPCRPHPTFRDCSRRRTS